MVKEIHIQHFTDYLKNKGHKRKTIKIYNGYLLKFMKSHRVYNQGSVNEYISDPSNQNSPCRAFLRNLKEFLKTNKDFYCYNDEFYQDLIEVELPKITGRTRVRIPRYLNKEQINLLEKHFKDEREKLCLLVSYYCGLRLGELVKIGINDFDFDKWGKTNYEDYLEVRVFGKGDKEGIALIPSFLGKRIANYINSKTWYEGKDKIFVSTGIVNNSDTIGRSFQMKLRKAGVDSGISKVDSEGKIIEGTQIHPHLLRHSFGASLIQKGVDIRKIQELLRHSSITSTQIYTHLDKSQLKDELRSIGHGFEGENVQKSPNSSMRAT